MYATRALAQYNILYIHNMRRPFQLTLYNVDELSLFYFKSILSFSVRVYIIYNDCEEYNLAGRWTTRKPAQLF